MTTINKEVTREEERTKTVKTCDVCGLSEIEMASGVGIDRITSGIKIENTYSMIVKELESPESDTVVNVEREAFDSYDEAKAAVDEIDPELYHVDTSMVANVNWELDIDACERCQQMMFGAMRDNFSMKSV